MIVFLKKLFQKSAREVDPDGRTRLHYAAGPELNLRKVRALVAAGADVNAADRNGWTPLHAAAQYNAVEAARLLVSAGAVVDSTDRDGNTPLTRAVSSYRGDGAVIQLLRQHGADPYFANKHGTSPVSWARGVANYDVAKFFADLPE